MTAKRVYDDFIRNTTYIMWMKQLSVTNSGLSNSFQKRVTW